jgi:hypothetical protein
MEAPRLLARISTKGETTATVNRSLRPRELPA